MSSSAPNAVLSVSGIGKTYAQPVLSDITLTLNRGEVLALTGENGAGKSTLSKIIGGLVTPTTGHMQFNGQDYRPGSRTQAEELGVRMVMQELNLLPTLTVAENLFLDNLPSPVAGSAASNCVVRRSKRWPGLAWRRSTRTLWSAAWASAISKWSRSPVT